MAVATCVLKVLKFSNDSAVCVAVVPSTTPVVLVSDIPVGAEKETKTVNLIFVMICYCIFILRVTVAAEPAIAGDARL